MTVNPHVDRARMAKAIKLETALRTAGAGPDELKDPEVRRAAVAAVRAFERQYNRRDFHDPSPECWALVEDLMRESERFRANQGSGS